MSSEPIIHFPPFRLDVRNEQLWREEELIPLRPKPFAVLAYLATHPDRLVTAKELRTVVWPDSYVSEGLLRVYIRDVRRALGDEAERPTIIETIPRRGYRFVAAVTATTVSSAKFQVPSQTVEPANRSQRETRNLKPETPLVGRTHELSLLHQWLGKAAAGTRQVVFVSGEPGIGKTTLVDAFLQSLASCVLSPEEEERESEATAPRLSPPGPWIAQGQCIEHYGAGEAYLPVLEALSQLYRQPSGKRIVTFLNRYAPTWLIQMPALVSDAEFEALQRKVQGTTRERMLREMAEMLEALTAEQPLVLVLEDIHWSDHSTLDLLSLLAQRRGPARLFVLATYRPADVVVSGHPLRVLKQELRARGQCEEIALGFLTTAEVSQYLDSRFPQHEFPPALGRIMHQSTEGNPLFMVNVVEEWVRQEFLLETNGQWRLAAQLQDLAAGVPESLRQMIERQLERLTPEEQRALETASVVGAEFTTAAVAAGLAEQPQRVEAWCERLAKRGQFLRARTPEMYADDTLTGRYGFLHALYPQVLYERLGELQRAQLHRRIGEWEVHAYSAQLDEHAAQLALHFERGQDYQRAVQYCYQAGQHAQRRFATTEAAHHYRHGLTVLVTLPQTRERAEQELSLLVALGISSWGTTDDIDAVYTRIDTLAQQLDLPLQRMQALDGMMRSHFLRGDLQRAQEIGKQGLALAEKLNDPLRQVKAAATLAAALFHAGEVREACELTSSVIAQYDTLVSPETLMQLEQNPKATALSLRAFGLWLLGYPGQARDLSRAVLRWVNEQRSPFEIVLVQCFVTMLAQCLGEATVHQQAEVGVTAASEYGSSMWEGIGRTVWGWSLVAHGQREAGWEQLQQGETLQRVHAVTTFRAYTLALLADAHRRSHQIEAGLATVTEALTHIEQTGERFWEAELHRLRGELVLPQEVKNQQAKGKKQKGAGDWGLETRTSSPQAPSLKPLVPSGVVMREAEACFRKAIEIARAQQAKSLELRAVMSLVRLRLSQTRPHDATRHMQRESSPLLDEAHNMLSEIYNWFTEGFDTQDLQEAQALLTALHS